MKNNFWQNFKKPICALAPMAGITDSAFRQICKSFGADVLYSEMASATALVYNSKKTLELLAFNKKVERPYVVQLFGNNPEHFRVATKIIEKKIKPDGIDINFGCPVPKITKQGAGASLMQNLELAREVIEAVINNTKLPVSIKLRAKSGEIDCLQFLNSVRDLKIGAVMIHGRTLRQGFSGPVDAEIIKKARNYFNGIILANGGIISKEDAEEILKKTGADGIGIARGALGRPWIFRSLKTQNGYEYTENIDKIFKIILKHAKLVEKLKGKQGIVEMRKHLCWYMQGLPGAKKMREKLVKVESLKDIEKILK